MTIWHSHHLYSSLTLHPCCQWQIFPCRTLFSELQQHPGAVCSSCVAPSQPFSLLPFLLLLLLLTTLLHPQAASAVSMLTAVSLSAAVVEWRDKSVETKTQLWGLMLIPTAWARFQEQLLHDALANIEMLDEEGLSGTIAGQLKMS